MCNCSIDFVWNLWTQISISKYITVMQQIEAARKKNVFMEYESNRKIPFFMATSS